MAEITKPNLMQDRSPLPEHYTLEEWRALTWEERQAHIRFVVSMPNQWPLTYLKLALYEVDRLQREKNGYPNWYKVRSLIADALGIVDGGGHHG